jgi:rubrerythrin
MSDDKILKQIAVMEKKSVDRYSQQIESTKYEPLLEILEQILQDEKSHYNEAEEKLSQMNPNFKEELVPLFQEIEPSNEISDNYDSIKGIIDDNIEDEKVSDSEYAGYADEVQDPEIKAMIISFGEEEKEHVSKLKKLLPKIKKDKSL